MKIETKFNIGDEIFILNGGSINYKIINGIDISCSQTNSITEEKANIKTATTITYRLNGISAREDSCYETREEAARRWLKQQGISDLK
jgi:hypothetical protein